MKRIIAILAFASLSVGCGEQFQATYTGQVMVTKDCSQGEHIGEFYNFSVNMQLTGGGATFLITEFQPEPGSGLNAPEEFFLGRKFGASMDGNNEFNKHDTQVPLSEGFQKSILFSLDPDQVTDAVLEEIKYDDILLFGSVSSDRQKIDTLTLQWNTQVPDSDGLRKCSLGFRTDQNGLNIVK